MFDLQPIIDLALAEEGLILTYHGQKENTLIEEDVLPKTSIGHFLIQSETASAPGANVLQHELGENLIESFEIHIQDLPENLFTTWRKVHNALVGKNPFTVREQNSIISYKEGTISGYENGQIKWIDIYALSFPSLNPYL